MISGYNPYSSINPINNPWLSLVSDSAEQNPAQESSPLSPFGQDEVILSNEDDGGLFPNPFAGWKERSVSFQNSQKGDSGVIGGDMLNVRGSYENSGNASAKVGEDGIRLNGGYNQSADGTLVVSDPTGTFFNTTKAGVANKGQANFEVDYKNPRVRVNAEQSFEAYVENESKVNLGDDVSLQQKRRLSAGEELKFDVNSAAYNNKDEGRLGGNVDLGAKAEIKNTTTSGVTAGDTTFEWESEQKVFADAHIKAKNEVVSNKDEFSLAAGYDLGAEAGVGDKETLRAKSKSGSLFEVSGDISAGKGASTKGGLNFSRKNDDKSIEGGGGSTEIGFTLGGKFMAGAGVELKMKLADRDIDTALGAALPMGPLIKAVGGGEVLKSGLKALPGAIDSVRQLTVADSSTKPQSSPTKSEPTTPGVTIKKSGPTKA